MRHIHNSMHTIKLKHFLNYTIVFCVLLLASSCSDSGSSLKKYGTVFESVVLSDEGTFRSFNLGDSQDDILNNEQTKPIEQDKGYLYYEFPIDTIGSFNVTYTFDEMGLNQIQSDIFINSAEKTEDVYNKFKTYFDEHYGNNQSQMGFNIWSVKSEKFGEIKISLTNQSSDFATDVAPGKISLWIYPATE